jgi:hypothetical protein
MKTANERFLAETDITEVVVRIVLNWGSRLLKGWNWGCAEILLVNVSGKGVSISTFGVFSGRG